jgi:hypothetical protein
LTSTETATLSLTPTLSATPTATASVSLTPTFTPTASLTASLSPTPTSILPPTFPPPTPGMPDYDAWLREAQQRRSAQLQGESLLLDEACDTDINEDFAIVAPTTDNGRAVDFYGAIGQAYQPGSASPYPIYLCEGTFPLNETVVLFVDIIIYGRGVDASLITQSNTSEMGGMFTLNDNHLLEFHNLTVHDGRARVTGAGAVNGGAVLVHSGTLRVYDSKFQSNEAAFLGGVIAGGENIELVRSHFLGNLADDSGGVLYVGNVSAECVRFEANRADQVRGGAIAVNGGGVISNSSFTGNTAGQEAHQIFNYDWNTVTDAQGSWWASAPQFPDDVSGGINTGMQLLNDPTAAYAIGDYYNQSSPCRMIPASDIVAQELAYYGVTTSGNWSDDELHAIVSAVRRTAQALGQWPDEYHPVATFNTILSNTGIQFVRTSSSENNCITNKNATPITITCRGNVVINEYLIVHELGHVFVGKTSSGSVTFFGRVENPDPANQFLRDGNNVFVMGPRGWIVGGDTYNDWQRSNRNTDNGWGSAALVPGPCDGSITPPPGVPFPFQQNPCEIDTWLYTPGSTIRIAEVEEAAADMFLNLVYRATTDNGMSWEGFQNKLWRDHESPQGSGIIVQCYLNGCNDPGNSGDTRVIWMSDLISELFTEYGWW